LGILPQRRIGTDCRRRSRSASCRSTVMWVLPDTRNQMVGARFIPPFAFKLAGLFHGL
jgi:hypothetical protein